MCKYEHKPLSTGRVRFLDISGTEKKKTSQAQGEILQTKWWIMLPQQLSSHRGSMKTDKIFSAEELKKATNNYDKSRVLGQ
jgi:hypothetical protein